MESEWETYALDQLVDPDRGISYGIVQPGTPVSHGVPIVRVGRVDVGIAMRLDGFSARGSAAAPIYGDWHQGRLSLLSRQLCRDYRGLSPESAGTPIAVAALKQQGHALAVFHRRLQVVASASSRWT